MYLGEYRHNVDEKYRFRIPAKLKQQLGPDPFMTVGSNNCIFVVRKEDAPALINSLVNRSNVKNLDESRVTRMIGSRGFFAVEDKQGRIAFPPVLMKHAKVIKNLVTIGCVGRVEIWAEEVWDEYSSMDGDEFDACLQSLSDITDEACESKI